MGAYFLPLFPLSPSHTLSSVYAYHILANPQLEEQIRGKVFYLLKRQFPNLRWFWHQGKIFADKKLSPSQVQTFLEDLWEHHRAPLAGVRGLGSELWEQVPPLLQAEYVRQVYLDAHQQEALATLRREEKVWPEVKGEIAFWSRSFLVQGKPAIGIGVYTRLVSRKNLNELLSLQEHSLWLGREVTLPHRALRGRIVELVGTLKEERARLLRLAQEDFIVKHLQNGRDGDWVVSIQIGERFYEYPATALHIWLQPEDYPLFSISRHEVSPFLEPSVATQVNWIKKLSHFWKRQGWLEDAYSTQRSGQLFENPLEDEDFYIRLADGQESRFNPQTLLSNLEVFGPWSQGGGQHREEVPLQVLSALEPKKSQGLLTEIRSTLEKMGLFPLWPKVIYLREEEDWEKSLAQLGQRIGANSRLCLWLISQKHFRSHSAFLQRLPYLFPFGTPQQILNVDHWQEEKYRRVFLLALLAKVSGPPFLLAREVLPDRQILGATVLSKGERLWLALRRFDPQGGYIEDRFVHGPPEASFWKGVWEKLFSSHEKYVLHRFSRHPFWDELDQWASEKGVDLAQIQVTTFQVPSIYQRRSGEDLYPPWGTTFQIDERELLLVMPNWETLHVFSPTLPWREGARSVFTAGLLHYSHDTALPATLFRLSSLLRAHMGGDLPERVSVPLWL